LKYIDQKTEARILEKAKTSIQASRRSLSQVSEDDIADAITVEEDKKKYGALLPKSGVYFLPDERLNMFLSVVREIKKKYEAQGEYQMIDRYTKLLERYRKDEEHRLLHNMKVAQLNELANIERAQ